MLRLLILFLILNAKVVSSLEYEGSGTDLHTDEEDDDDVTGPSQPEKSSGETEEGNLITIIIAAVCVFALAVLAVVAVILFKHHLQKREQGVYTVPVEQQQKGI